MSRTVRLAMPSCPRFAGIPLVNLAPIASTPGPHIPLTLRQREQITGRCQSLYDPVALTWYCLACLEDLPAEPSRHGDHTCQ
ncbi:hypothetical protein ABZ801_01140 [Actinomadura sp. NPDC047616]|uniref:hypothetical protein n=1 Tax=Actinomadura sp. NPDC047616 TaxID=3155914 RepID=UPI0033D7FAF2